MLRARAAFTLLEMLVVIGIMMVLLGLSIGAVMHTPKVNALIATEHLVADIIRQARHTARSSGAPVMIEIRKGDRQILGVSQITLYNDSFETQPPKLAVRTAAVPAPMSVANGLTGRGLGVGAFIETDATLK
nr:prepilin-type N-terminal cleavage/methylation domain-containing protein [Planctomycetota bacterium]